MQPSFTNKWELREKKADSTWLQILLLAVLFVSLLHWYIVPLIPVAEAFEDDGYLCGNLDRYEIANGTKEQAQEYCNDLGL